MKKKFPNASILSMITQNEDGVEKLLFIYLKTIPDFYPGKNIYWYEGAGQNGIHRNVWLKKSIRQWVACGEDSKMKSFFDSILSSGSFKINDKIINLSIPHFNSILHIPNSIKNFRGVRFDTFVTKNNTLIPKEFYQKENLQFLSGYKTGSNQIKTLFPIGFYEDNFIYENLKNGIWGVCEYRTAFLTFHGVRESSVKGKGSHQFVGFYQQNFKNDSEYTAIVKNSNQIEIGTEIIDKRTGFFKIKLNEPTKNGALEVQRDTNSENSIEFNLIQDIQVNTEVSNTSFKDAYGREFLMTSFMKNRPSKIQSFTWQQNIYVNNKEGNQKLSDLIKSIFDYLGPKILIADPYFINNITHDITTKVPKLTHCQSAFINALIHSSVEKGITQFNVLGCSRATNHLDTDETGSLTKIDLMINSYEKVFRSFIKESQLEKYFPPATIFFRKAKEDFHNRYWFSLKEIDGIEVLDKCVIITNSIGNMSELDIIPVTSKSQISQITRKYTGLFKNSEIRLSI